MQPFALSYPVKPYKLNQEWGKHNPDAYEQFGFTRHNGVDLRLVNGQQIHAPIDAVVRHKSYQEEGAGFYLILQTPERYIFLDGTIAYVELSFFHLLKEPTIPLGTFVKAGELIALGDNTGFSTGQHLHFRLRRLKLVNSLYVVIDKNEAQNSIDPVPYFNGQYAEDIAPAFKHFFPRDLEPGSISDEVMYLQTMLKMEGCFTYPEITRFYGNETIEAVKRFQKKYGIISWGTPRTTGYGRFGPKTRQKANVLYG